MVAAAMPLHRLRDPRVPRRSHGNLPDVSYALLVRVYTTMPRG
jgi:hypothetical protein